ncbi:MAG: ribonuclease J [Christensenellales bacterium]|jgi:ribonuclease J
MAKKVKLVFLGGVGEIGKNMTALEYNGDIIVIDAGLAFPNAEEMPGIDYVIPDYSYLIENKDKVRAYIITHGHEDHIGGLPYVLKDVPAPIYAGKLAVGLIAYKLSEHKMEAKELYSVQQGDVITLGCFSVEFVKTNHSITNSFALCINTPKGVIFHTSDFKMDLTPIDNKPIDLTRIAGIGKAGVLLLLSDSTNVERPGISMSERQVYRNLDNIFAENKGRRIIVATFASNVHRVQQIIDCAIKYDRKIAFSGRSMVKIAEIAKGLKELTVDESHLVDIDKIDKVPYDRLCVISTGTQGEPMSALTRMSQGDFKKLEIGSMDTIIMSASPIPGNEKYVYTVINNLYRKGANVIYKALEEVHASGHAFQEELKMMLALVRPKFFIPVHGEYRHMKQHADLAMEMGIPESNIVIPEIGNVIGVEPGGLSRQNNVQAGKIMLDGAFSSEDYDLILRDRKLLSEDGLVIVIIELDAARSALISPPDIIVRGIRTNPQIEDTMREYVTNYVSSNDLKDIDLSELKRSLRKGLAKIINKGLKKNSMIIPIIIED